MRERTATDRWRGWRADPLLTAGVVLIGLQTAQRAFVLAGSYFWQDDLFHLSLYRRTGLSWEFVVRDHNGHLEMGTNLVYALIGANPSPSFVPAALLVLVLQLVASGLLLAVLRLLFGRSPWILLPFAAYLFTPLALATVTWFAAGLQALPLQIAMLTALLGGIRAYRSRSWQWAAVSVAGTATGLFFWEKAVFVLPALVAVLLLVEEAGTPWRRSVKQVANFWPFLLPHVLMVAAYVPFYLSLGGPSVKPTLGDAIPSAAETLFAMLLPGLFGGPWTAEGAESTVTAAPGTVQAVIVGVLAFGVVAVSIRLRGVRAVKAWFLVLGYIAADVVLVQIGRGDYLSMAARDPRYITDALPVVIIGCCAAFSGPRRALAAGRRWARPARAVAPAAAVSALLASCLLTNFLVLGELQHRPSQNYLAGVMRTMAADPGGSVVSSQPPIYVALNNAFDLEDTLHGLGQEYVFDRPGTDMGIFDRDGILRSVVLLEPIMQATGPVDDCGWALPAEEQQIGFLPIWFGLQVLRFTYTSPAEVTLHLAVGDDRQDLTVPPGTGKAMFVVTGQQGPVTVRASGAPAGAVCVDDFFVGTPWPEGRATNS